MKNIFLFPGLAADERMFSALHLDHATSRVVKYISPTRKETLQNYSRRVAERLPIHEQSIFIGVSFGGILAQEVAHFYPAEKIILVSSISSLQQLTFFHALFKVFPLYDWLNEWTIKKLVIQVSRTLTIKDQIQKNLFESMVRDADIHLIRWGIRQTLHWKQINKWENTIHIHGSKDRIFPISKIPVNYSIADGQHFMIVQKGEELSFLLQQLID